MEPPPTLPPQRPPPSPPPSPLAPAVEEGRQLDIEVLYVLFAIVMVLCGFFMWLQRQQPQLGAAVVDLEGGARPQD